MMDKTERDEKIELYGRGYDLLMQTLKDIPQETWKFKRVECVRDHHPHRGQ